VKDAVADRVDHIFRVILKFRMTGGNGETANGFDHGQIVEVISDGDDFCVGIKHCQLEDPSAFIVPTGTDIDRIAVDVSFHIRKALKDGLGQGEGVIAVRRSHKEGRDVVFGQHSVAIKGMAFDVFRGDGGTDSCRARD
jgi:hypothetical protein